MITDKFGRIVFNEHDLCDLLMQGHKIFEHSNVNVDQSVAIDKLVKILDIDHQNLMSWKLYREPSESIAHWDYQNQENWFMPDDYKNLDIAEYVLSLCKSDAELQRVGQELLLFQEKNLFNLLKYLKYLVDTMKAHQIIWGVGRGSSVASYVLYLLEVHKIDSIYYDLDIREFLR